MRFLSLCRITLMHNSKVGGIAVGCGPRQSLTWEAVRQYHPRSDFRGECPYWIVGRTGAPEL